MTFWNYILRTWSGRILAVNFVVFALMSWLSGSVMLPSPEVLHTFGAKEPIALVQGEWWRFITPIFVHIGIVHFLFNSYAIYIIGYQLEKLIGVRWFLFIYLLSGISGAVASSLWTVAVSAGASGAILGLLGCGLCVELTVARKYKKETGEKLRVGPYLTNVVFIAAMGFVIPNVDNGAHFGGLLSGVVLGAAMLMLTPNRLLPRPFPALGAALIALNVALCLFGARLSMTSAFVVSKFVYAAEESSRLEDKVFYFEKARRLEPQNGLVLVSEARVLLNAGIEVQGFELLRNAAERSDNHQRLVELAVEFENAGDSATAEQIRRLLPRGI